jgi:hypothetical protein
MFFAFVLRVNRYRTNFYLLLVWERGGSKGEDTSIKCREQNKYWCKSVKLLIFLKFSYFRDTIYLFLKTSSLKGFNGKLSKYFFFKCEHILFFSNSDSDFYSENNNVSQVYTYITKIQKKSLKNATIAYALHFALNIGDIFAQSPCYYLSFVFPAYLICYYIVTKCILIASRLVLVICFTS